VKILVKHFVVQIALSVVVLLAAMQLFTTTVKAAEVSDIPDLVVGEQNWVMDYAKVLSSSTETAISSQLKSLEETTGKQVHFVTVQRLDFAVPVSDFASQLFDKWFPTDQEKADQTLLVIATEDYRTAIATGKNIQALMPESVANSVASETVLFPTQQAHYNQAVADGTARLMAILSGEPDPGPPAPVIDTTPAKNFKSAEETDANSSTILVIVLLLLATAIPMVTYYWFQNSNG
jgi:uncharacterized protein